MSLAGLIITPRLPMSHPTPRRDPTKLGAAVRAFMSGHDHGLPVALLKAKRSAETALEQLTEALEAVKAATPPGED